MQKYLPRHVSIVGVETVQFNLSILTKQNLSGSALLQYNITKIINMSNTPITEQIK